MNIRITQILFSIILISKNSIGQNTSVPFTHIDNEKKEIVIFLEIEYVPNRGFMIPYNAINEKRKKVKLISNDSTFVLKDKGFYYNCFSNKTINHKQDSLIFIHNKSDTIVYALHVFASRKIIHFSTINEYFNYKRENIGKIPELFIYSLGDNNNLKVVVYKRNSYLMRPGLF
jgi:hypothetical protein